MRSRTAAAVIVSMLALLGGAAGCRSEQPQGERVSTQPADVADPLSVDQPERMAADDAARFRPPPAEREPSRRPREREDRRPVDQPRIRP